MITVYVRENLLLDRWEAVIPEHPDVNSCSTREFDPDQENLRQAIVRGYNWSQLPGAPVSIDQFEWVDAPAGWEWPE